jgi:preprotein translocase subunit YajC
MLTFSGQIALAQAASGRFVGTITAINGDTLTVKADSGDMRQVEVPSSAVLKRVEPGQKDLSSAAAIQLSDLATGDRVLVRLDPSASGDTPQAAQIVTIKQADVAEKQQQDREAWTRSGVGGLVKSVEPAAGVIVLTTGSGTTLKIIKVRVGPSTVLKRYAPASIRYDLAQPGPIDAIQPGDQLRARGTKNADGTEIDAAEIVSGSFRNISGTIASMDTSSSTFTVKDLLTKKQVTVRVTPDAQMHALPEMMARAMAARLKGTAPSAGGAAPAAVPGGGQRNWNGQGGGGGQGRGGDMQQMLNRTPVIHFSDLKKGDAVMVVSTAGSSDVTAIALLTGVEPLLEAPEASRNLLSNWSMGSGGGGEAETP